VYRILNGVELHGLNCPPFGCIVRSPRHLMRPQTASSPHRFATLITPEPQRCQGKFGMAAGGRAPRRLTSTSGPL
jgi:hypothetical protein